MANRHIAGCKVAGRRESQFYRLEAERQCQISTASLELLVELVRSLPHYCWLGFEGEQASVANWKMDPVMTSYCFLLILNIKQTTINHSQLDGFYLQRKRHGAEKIKDFQKAHRPGWTLIGTGRSYRMQIRIMQV